MVQQRRLRLRLLLSTAARNAASLAAAQRFRLRVLHLQCRHPCRLLLRLFARSLSRLGCELCLDLCLLSVETLLRKPVLLRFFRSGFLLPPLLLRDLLLQIHLVLVARYVRARTGRVAAVAALNDRWWRRLPPRLWRRRGYPLLLRLLLRLHRSLLLLRRLRRLLPVLRVLLRVLLVLLLLLLHGQLLL
jgi:hypothetical protein